MMNLLRKFKFEILVFLFFILIRLPDLGHDNFNTDVWKWKSRTYDFSTGIFTLKPELTVQKYHPGVTLMWLGTFGVKLANFYFDNIQLDYVLQIFFMDYVQKLFVVTGIAFGAANVFYLLRQFFGNKFAVLSLTIMTLEPFYLGLTRFYHLEGLMSTFMFASALWFYKFLLDTNSKHTLFISSFFGALAILTKTSALYMIPFVGLALLTHSHIKLNSDAKSAIRFVAENLSLWIFSFITFSIIIWPALWSVPLNVFEVLYKGIFIVGVDTDHIQYFFGKLVDNPGPLFYLVILLYRSSVYLILGLVLLIFSFAKLEKKETKFITYMLMFAFFYVIELTLPSKKLDRYVLPSLMALSLVSSFGIFYYYQKLKLNEILKFIFLIIPISGVILFIHPDYMSYYSPLYGGLRNGIHVIEPKWMIGTEEVITFFKKEMESGNFTYSGVDESFEELLATGRAEKVLSVGFHEKYYTQIWPFFREFGAWAVVRDLSPFALKTEYFVYPVWDDNSEEENRFELEYYDTIKVRGVPVYNVYKRVKIWIPL